MFPWRGQFGYSLIFECILNTPATLTSIQKVTFPPALFNGNSNIVRSNKIITGLLIAQQLQFLEVLIDGHTWKCVVKSKPSA
jgi:hypothetical protein